MLGNLCNGNLCQCQFIFVYVVKLSVWIIAFFSVCTNLSYSETFEQNFEKYVSVTAFLLKGCYYSNEIKCYVIDLQYASIEGWHQFLNISFELSWIKKVFYTRKAL